MLILRPSRHDTPGMYTVIAKRDGREWIVGGICRHPGIYPEGWQWSLNFVSRTVLPAPIVGMSATQEDAMAAFRARWDEVLPLIRAEDWEYKWAHDEAVRERAEMREARASRRPVP